MADRVSVTITLGGTIAPTLVDQLIAAINSEGLTLEYEGGEPIGPQDLINGQPLTLCAHEVAWGTLNLVEDFCREHCLPYCRSYASFPGGWSGGRSIYRGVDMVTALHVDSENTPHVVSEYIASDNDEIMIDAETAERLGSYDAIMDYFADADFTVPPLEIIDLTASRQMDAIVCPT